MSVTSDLARQRKAIEQVAAHKRALDERIEECKRRREELEVLPLPRSELIAQLHEWVDKQRCHYSRHLRACLAPHIKRPLRGFQERPVQHLPILQAGHGGYSNATVINVENLYCIFAAPIKQAIREAIEEWDDYEEGPPLEQRLGEIAHLDEEIERLEAEYLEIEQFAHQMGVRL